MLAIIICVLLLSSATSALSSTSYDDRVDMNTTNLEAPEPLRIFLLGDWGKGGLDGDITAQSTSYLRRVLSSALLPQASNNKVTYTYQAAIARTMSDFASIHPVEAVLALGDNFYNQGVQSTTDSLWSSLFKQVYITDNPGLQVPWYPVHGNHDYGYGATGVRAQIERYTKHPTDDGFWTFPSTNYSVRFDIPGGGSVQVIFIDTTTLAPSENGCCNSKSGVSSTEQAARIADQLMHIKLMLDAAVADPPTWLIVAGHYPMFSVGEHGDTKELQSYLLPLLTEYKVNAFICGHDHMSAHLQYGDIDYFVAGAGALTDSSSKNSAATLLWAGKGYSAFAMLIATEDALTIDYINIKGEVVYSYTREDRFHLYDGDPGPSPEEPLPDVGNDDPPPDTDPGEDGLKGKDEPDEGPPVSRIGGGGDENEPIEDRQPATNPKGVYRSGVPSWLLEAASSTTLGVGALLVFSIGFTVFVSRGIRRVSRARKSARTLIEINRLMDEE